MVSVIGCGPFIGSFDEEVLTFRPYVEWIKRNVSHTDFYISTHLNRRFLYDIPDRQFFSVDLHLTEHENKQKGYVHSFVSQRDYTRYISEFKGKISENGYQKKDINIINLGYAKTPAPISIYQKNFKSIPIPNVKIDPVDVVFIPDKVGNIKVNKSIFYWLCDELQENVEVIGNRRIHLENNNIIEDVASFDDMYKYIIRYIYEASYVFCPVGIWTAISNMMGKKVFSWGKRIGQYKLNGVYNFRNKNATVVYHDKEINIEKMYDQIDHFLGGR